MHVQAVYGGNMREEIEGGGGRGWLRVNHWSQLWLTNGLIRSALTDLKTMDYKQEDEKKAAVFMPSN